MLRRTLVLLCMALAGACKTGRNYPDPAQPRYAGVAQEPPLATAGDTLRIVSFNVEFSEQVQRAIRALRSERSLRSADVLLLQEMTAPAARAIADSLRMSYVYYPAIYNKVFKRDVGNAVLSRWPIVEDAKLILPARSRYAKTQRIATAATIRFGERRVRVYSTHLGTAADLGKEGRAEQLDAIVADASKHELVVIGGDMNSSDIGEVAEQRGYRWPTQKIPMSTDFGRLDHVFLRGLAAAGAGTTGTTAAVSDHRPIWVTATVPKK